MSAAANMAYLAAPIDLGQLDQSWRRLRELVQTQLLTTATVTACYRPDNAWAVGDEPEAFPELQWVNTHALDSASVLVAFLPTGVPTIGTILEIQNALVLQIPTVLVVDEGVPSRSFSLNHLLASNPQVCQVVEADFEDGRSITSTAREVSDEVRRMLDDRSMPRRVWEDLSPWGAGEEQEVDA